MKVTKTKKLDYNIRRGQMPGLGRPVKTAEGKDDAQGLSELDRYHALQGGEPVEVTEDLARWLFKGDYALPADDEAKDVHAEMFPDKEVMP